MCLPERPQRDHYDDNSIVLPHFTPTPSLSFIPRGHRYNYCPETSCVDKVRSKIDAIYRKHKLSHCPRHGLYWAGSRSFNMDKENDKTMLLVIELRRDDLEKWRVIESEVRELMRALKFSGKAGICVRFYSFNKDARVSTLPDEASLSSAGAASTRTQTQGSSPQSTLGSLRAVQRQSPVGPHPHTQRLASRANRRPERAAHFEASSPGSFLEEMDEAGNHGRPSTFPLESHLQHYVATLRLQQAINNSREREL